MTVTQVDPVNGGTWGGTGRRGWLRRVTAGRPRRSRAVRRWVLLGLGFVVAAGVAWIAVTGWLARTELQQVKVALGTLHATAGGDRAAARSAAADLRTHAANAHRLTTGPAWAVAASVPLLGDPIESVRGLAAGADVLAARTVPALLTASGDLEPALLRTADNRIDVDRLAAAADTVHGAATDVRRVSGAVDRLPHTTWLPAVDDARAAVAGSLRELRKTLDGADRATRILPVMLGADGPKTYFIGILNEAQARGVGGIPGAFAIAVADRGAIQLRSFDNDGALWNVPTGLDFGDDYTRRYEGAQSTDYIVNSTISPHFPYAAQVWAAMWQRRTGERLDGALAIDPTALSYLLAVAGPAVVPGAPGGERVDAGNVVALTQSTVYFRFDDQAARKAYLIELARAVEQQILRTGDLTGLVRAGAKAAGERRLLAWSADPAVQSVIAETSLAGEVERTAAPYAGPVVVNAAANKLDYYLDRSVRWRRTGCGKTRDVTVTITLTNNAPLAGLPTYVSQREDRHDYPVSPGDQRLHVSYYATTGALLRKVTVDGTGVLFTPGSERGHPTYQIDLELPRGATRTITLRLREPAGEGSLQVLRQPLVRPLRFDAKDESCG